VEDHLAVGAEAHVGDARAVIVSSSASVRNVISQRT